MAFFENTRKPTGFGGRLMVTMMNIGHRALADWGLRFLPLAENADVLDCGCGGGANLRLMLKKCPTGKVCGIDYSPVSVEKSRKLNQTAVSAGRCEVLQASVQAWKLQSDANQKKETIITNDSIYISDGKQCLIMYIDD